MEQNYNPVSGFTNAKSLMEEVQMVQTLEDDAAGKAAGAASMKNATSGVSAQAITGGVANLAGNFIDVSDPLSNNYQGKLAAKTGLQGLAMGSQFGLPGMIIGGLGGAAYGAIKADDLTAEAKKTQGINTAFVNYEKNQIKQDPLTMAGKPLKMLTGIKGNIPHNMSAKQHNDALKMQEISGTSSLMFTEEGLNKLPNNIPGEFGDIVRKEKTEQQKKK